MSRAFSASSTVVRPTTVTIATVLTVIVAVANIAFMVVPGASDDVPMAVVVIGLLLGIAGLPAAYGLWRCRRWAMIATVVISAINFLASAPGIVAGPSGFAIGAAVVGTILSAATIVLVLMRDARASYV